MHHSAHVLWAAMQAMALQECTCLVFAAQESLAALCATTRVCA